MASFFVRDPKKLNTYRDLQKQNAALQKDVSNGSFPIILKRLLTKL
jgi:hypothetical protein